MIPNKRDLVEAWIQGFEGLRLPAVPDFKEHDWLHEARVTGRRFADWVEERTTVPNDDPDYPMSRWMIEVSMGNTALGYGDWVENQKEAAEERAITMPPLPAATRQGMGHAEWCPYIQTCGLTRCPCTCSGGNYVASRRGPRQLGAYDG